MLAIDTDPAMQDSKFGSTTPRTHVEEADALIGVGPAGSSRISGVDIT
jgi:hypothetical protein